MKFNVNGKSNLTDNCATVQSKITDQQKKCHKFYNSNVSVIADETTIAEGHQQEEDAEANETVARSASLKIHQPLNSNKKEMAARRRMSIRIT